MDFPLRKRQVWSGKEFSTEIKALFPTRRESRGEHLRQLLNLFLEGHLMSEKLNPRAQKEHTFLAFELFFFCF